jgi:hypothetical protein
MTALLLSTYLGYLSTLHNCRDFDCRLLKRFKGQPCEISVKDGYATAFGVEYPLSLVGRERTYIYEGWNGNLYMTLHFRPRGRIVRAYISEYADRRSYKRWTCEFGRENESGW